MTGRENESKLHTVLCAAALLACSVLASCARAPREIDITPQPAQTQPQTSAAIAAPTPDIPSATELPKATATPEWTPADTPAAADTPQPEKTAEQLDRVTVAEGFYYEKLSAALRERITGMSYPEEGGEISYADLRYITVKYVDFEGREHYGELVANKKVAKELAEIFFELYKAGYPIASMRLVDDYGEPGDDNLSMADNNTSCFNYRRITGSKTLSRHSYGMAIDINPVMNPYIDGSRVAPENAVPYADRTQKLPGMIDHDDLCYKLFTERGWSWGGDWDEPDYQHFSKPL